MTTKDRYTHQPFVEAFAEIMREKYGDAAGDYDLRPVLGKVEGYSYEALRLMLRGQRTLKMGAIEGISTVLGMSPHYFVEYRRMWADAMAQTYPELVDMVYEVALCFVELRETASSNKGPKDSSAPRTGQSG